MMLLKQCLEKKNYQLQIPRLGKKNDINNLTYYLKTLEKEEKTTSKTGRRKETMKNRAEVDKMGNSKIIEKTSTTQTPFYEKMNKIYKPLVRLTKRKKEKVPRVRK